MNENKNDPENKQGNEENEVGANPPLEDTLNNENNIGDGDNANVKLNADFDDPNGNVNDVDAPRGVKVMPK